VKCPPSSYQREPIGSSPSGYPGAPGRPCPLKSQEIMRLTRVFFFGEALHSCCAAHARCFLWVCAFSGCAPLQPRKCCGVPGGSWPRRIAAAVALFSVLRQSLYHVACFLTPFCRGNGLGVASDDAPTRRCSGLNCVRFALRSIRNSNPVTPLCCCIALLRRCGSLVSCCTGGRNQQRPTHGGEGTGSDDAGGGVGVGGEGKGGPHVASDVSPLFFGAQALDAPTSSQTSAQQGGAN
jgi:hypothetical protein